MPESRKTIWEWLLTPLRKAAYNNLPAREFSPYDSSDYTSQYEYETFDTSNFSGIIKELLSGKKSKEWLQRARSIVNTYKDNPNKPEDYYDALSYIGHEDARDKYLQMPQKSNTIVKSNYKPSISKDKNIDYFTFNYWTPEYWGRNNHEQPSHIEASMEDFAKNNSKPGNSQAYDTTLNEFRRGYGIDPKKGQYMSIYDIWDYNTAIKGGGADNIASKIGARPFEIYDRIYLDDYYKVNSKPRKGVYYGGYIPEVVIFPKN